jgi:hypothetical protein
MVLVAVFGAYVGLIALTAEYRRHVIEDTQHIYERIADIEHITASGMLPETREELGHLRYDFADLAHRMSLVELENARIDAELSRIKPLFAPRQIPTK